MGVMIMYYGTNASYATNLTYVLTGIIFVVFHNSWDEMKNNQSGSPLKSAHNPIPTKPRDGPATTIMLGRDYLSAILTRGAPAKNQ